MGNLLRAIERADAVAAKAVRAKRVDYRPPAVIGDFAYVPLTKGYSAVIDADLLPLVEGYNWCALVSPWSIYAYRRGPKTDDGKAPMFWMHRVLLNAPPGLLVDHINGYGLDNRTCNLRLATPSQNGFNSALAKDNTSGVKGVCWEKRRHKWRAVIVVNGRQTHLGNFATLDEARLAREAAAERMHGEFRCKR